MLKRLPDINLTEFQGLADFEQILAAVDAELGTEALTLYRSQWTRIAADVIEGDRVALAIITFAKSQCLGAPWVGTAGDLLDRLAADAPPNGHTRKEWPKSPRALGGALRRLTPALAALGVEVIAPSPTDKARKFVLRLTASTAQQPQGASEVLSPVAEPQQGTANGPPEASNNSLRLPRVENSGNAKFGPSGDLGCAARDQTQSLNSESQLRAVAATADAHDPGDPQSCVRPSRLAGEAEPFDERAGARERGMP